MITLTNDEQWSVGGTVIEANNIAGVVSMYIDHINNFVTINLATGTQVAGVMTPSQRGAHLSMTINMLTGAVTLSGGPALFTLTPTQLTNMLNALKNIRNALENLATNNLIQGTFTNW